jgi:threonine synthase
MSELHPIRVLIVDDHSMVRRGLATILRVKPDLQLVGEASSGREAIEICSRVQPDVILMDLMMPGMDGFEVLEALKSDKQLSDVPVIVVSAKELTPAERERLSSQTDMLMQKGDFTDEELLEEILKRAP